MDRRTAVALCVLVLVACAQGPGPRDPVLAVIRTGGTNAGPPVVAAGAVWVANAADGTISHIDPAANRTVATVHVDAPQRMIAGGCVVRAIERDSLLTRRCDLPSGIAGDAGSLWAADDAADALVRIDTAHDRVAGSIPIGARPLELAVGGGSVWVTSYFNDPPVVVRLDARTGRVLSTIRDLPTGGCTGVAVGPDAVWLACTENRTVARIDPATDRITAVIPVDTDPLAIVAGGGAVWVRNEESGTLSRIDPGTDQIAARLVTTPHVGRSSVDAIALGPEGVWISGVTLQRVDVRTNRIAGRIAASGNGVAEGFGSLWVTGLDGSLDRVDPRTAR